MLIISWSDRLQAAPPAEAYGRLPAIEYASLSPSGQRYAFIAVQGNERRLAIAMADGKIIRILNAGNEKIRGIRWINDQRLLVIKSTTISTPLFWYENELFSYINIDIEAGTADAIFKGTRSVARAVFGNFGIYEIDGEWYGYFGGLGYGSTRASVFFEDGYIDLYRVNLATGLAKRVEDGTRFKSNWLVSPTGDIVANSNYDDDTGNWQLASRGPNEKILFEHTAPLGYVGLIGRGRSENTALIHYRTDDQSIYAEIDLETGQPERLLDQFNTMDLLHNSKGLLIGAKTKEAGGAYFFDPLHLARYNGTRNAFPGYQVEFLSATDDLGRLIVKTDGGDDSGTFWLVDIKSGQANPIGSAYPDVHSSDVGPTRWYHYKASDGLEIEAVLTLPSDIPAKKLPLVVMPHGGPIGVHDKLGFDYFAQAFAANGYAVLQPNYRGSSGYGHDFKMSGFGQWGRGMQTDLSDGVSALAAEGVIDSDRVCIVGASYGGYAALAGVSLQQGVYRCAVSIAGISHLNSLFDWKTRRGPRKTLLRYWKAAVGDENNADLKESLSPINYVEKVNAPILLIHGDDDLVVPLEQSENMFKALKKAGKDARYEVLKQEDHWLSNDKTRKKMVKISLDFVKQHNPP